MYVVFAEAVGHPVHYELYNVYVLYVHIRDSVHVNETF